MDRDEAWDRRSRRRYLIKKELYERLNQLSVSDERYDDSTKKRIKELIEKLEELSYEDGSYYDPQSFQY